MVVSVSLSMPGRTLLARPGRQSKNLSDKDYNAVYCKSTL